MGKTRLAGEVARRVADRFADGVWLVELAAVTDPVRVQSAVMAALGYASGPECRWLSRWQGACRLAGAPGPGWSTPASVEAQLCG